MDKIEGLFAVLSCSHKLEDYMFVTGPLNYQEALEELHYQISLNTEFNWFGEESGHIKIAKLSFLD